MTSDVINEKLCHCLEDFTSQTIYFQGCLEIYDTLFIVKGAHDDVIKTCHESSKQAYNPRDGK